jgi:hypothetical protein
MTTILTWIKNNILLAVGIAIVIVILFFGTGLKRMFRPHRVHHRRRISVTPRRKTYRSLVWKMRKSFPRSVGMHKASGRGYPKAGGGYIPFKRNKNGTIKKAAFVSGTVAAKRRMSHLRNLR